MIGVVRKDRGGAPQLFGEHRSGEEVGPGGSAEGEEEVGRGALRLAEAVGAADQEARLAPALVPPALEPAGEIEAGGRAALLVEGGGGGGLGEGGGGGGGAFLSGGGGGRAFGAGGEGRPPLSGSSVTFTGQATRLR